jgi:hypothetical protein
VRVEHYTTERIPNPSPTGQVSQQLFHEVRNAIVQACRKHGPTGPMGLFPVGRRFNDSGEFLSAWESGDANAVYWVIDDQYNDFEQYQYLECCDSAHFTTEWLEDIIATLASWPGWGVGVVNISDGYLLVFSDKLMVVGPPFTGSSDLPSVVAAVQASLTAS